MERTFVGSVSKSDTPTITLTEWVNCKMKLNA